MTRDDRNDEDGRNAILIMPDPPSVLERVQAKLKAAGIPPDLIKVTGIAPDGEGGGDLTLLMEPGIAEEVINWLSIRLHTGTERDEELPRIVGNPRPVSREADDAVTPITLPWVLGVSREGEPPNPLPESFAATERQNRAKAKRGDLPDHP